MQLAQKLQAQGSLRNQASENGLGTSSDLGG